MIIMRLWEIIGKKFDEIEKKVAVLPVGSIERHGDHLPLGTDTIIAEYIGEKIASVRKDTVLLPPVYYGSCRGLRDFPGTWDIDPNILYRYILNIILEAARHGFKLIVIVNGHGGNISILKLAAREAAFKTDIGVIVINWWTDLAQETRDKLFTKPGHAGEDETSVMLAINSSLVDMNYAKDVETEYPSIKIYSNKMEKSIYSEALTGAATKASKEKGAEWLKAIVDHLNKIIDETLILLEK
ncbi:MAG: creatininase family protein [Thermoprotei archaeon]|nr:MAG: creatininase family protein [Thermoprotei archaeon]